MAARDAGVERFFYSSSACVYAADKQTDTDVTALKEADAYPAMPEDGYGWEKLFTERMCRHFREDFGLETRVARYHNVYGPHGTWDGGREKAPAAICRKVVDGRRSPASTTIEIWGDGEQTRSFMYIDDCVEGIADDPAQRHRRAAQPRQRRAGDDQPAGRHRRGHRRHQAASASYNLDAPQGVRGRNSDNTHDPARSRLGAVDPPARRPGEDLPLDLRPGQARPGLIGDGVRAGSTCGRPARLAFPAASIASAASEAGTQTVRSQRPGNVGAMPMNTHTM